MVDLHQRTGQQVVIDALVIAMTAVALVDLVNAAVGTRLILDLVLDVDMAA